MSAPRAAMVMAAGLGTRMRPLTLDRPKALVEVAGRALLDRALDRVAEAGLPRAVVNAHHKAEMIAAHLAARPAPPDVVISDESDALLETGGGLRRAAPLLGPGPAFVLNSDAIWTGAPPLAALAAAWRLGAMGALLLLVPRERATGYTRAGDFHMDAGGALRWREEGGEAPFVHTGAHIADLATLDGAPEGAFSLALIWRRLAAEGRLFGVVHSGGWADVGTPAGVGAAEALLRAEGAP